MVVSTAPLSRVEARRRVGHHAEALMEMLLGCFLLGAATFAGLVFVRRPWPNRVDAIGFRLLPADPFSPWAANVTHLGSLTVLIAGAAVLCVAATMSRNWIRAITCLIAPIAAVLVVQTVAKPIVGRHFEGTSLSYPSGTVTAVAALAAASFLVVPRFAKPLVAVAGGVVVVGVCAVVVVLRWHYPTDALGGVCVGAGAVFAVDGLLLSIRNQLLVRLRS